MKKSLLVPAAAALGICIGCNTGNDDVNKAESKYQQAQRDANKVVADAEKEGAENIHETRKIVVDEINEKKNDVKEALDDANLTTAKERAEVKEAVREGNEEIQKAEAERRSEVAGAQVAADKKVADAKHELEETKRKAIVDGRKRIADLQDTLTTQEKQLTDAKAEVAAAETRLKDATDDNRVALQNALGEAQKAERKEAADVSEAKATLAREQAELKKLESKAE